MIGAVSLQLATGWARARALQAKASNFSLIQRVRVLDSVTVLHHSLTFAAKAFCVGCTTYLGAIPGGSYTCTLCVILFRKFHIHCANKQPQHGYSLQAGGRVYCQPILTYSLRGAILCTGCEFVG